jgi:hypothetical protein
MQKPAKGTPRYRSMESPFVLEEGLLSSADGERLCQLILIGDRQSP